ncbi:Tc toxin subunit A-related protein [Streptomyces sp. NPDC002309]
MARNYASERYSTKFVSKAAKWGKIGKSVKGKFLKPAAEWGKIGLDSEVPLEPEVPLEQKVQFLLLAGNDAYNSGKYQTALDRYLAAWALFPQFLYSPFFVPLYAAGIGDGELPDLDVDQLAEVSAAIHRYRPIVESAPIPLPSGPPSELVELTEHYTGTTGLAKERATAAAFFAHVGEVETAHSLMNEAIHLADSLNDQIRVSAIAGVMAMRNGDLDQAQGVFRQLRDGLEELGDRSAVAAMDHNMGVVHALNGQDGDGALVHFAAAANRLPRSLDLSITQGFNSGTAVTRPAGAEGLPFLICEPGGTFTEVPSERVAKPADTIRVAAGSFFITVSLTTGGGELIENILEPRVDATSLDFLRVPVELLPQFVSYLPHVRRFILPLALGDTYFALGDYERAARYYLEVRDYRYLNHEIERPMLWTRLARTYLAWADELYRQHSDAAARVMYEHIVFIRTDGSFALDGPLYEGGFTPLKDETLRFLQASDRLNFNDIDYSRRVIILEALSQLSQILRGMNYLGIEENIIPIHDWRYLQNSARYFASQAIQAERAYVNFKSTAEKEELTRVQLEQNVDAQRSAKSVEHEKLKAARAQVNVARLNQKLAGERIRLAGDQWVDYVRTGKKAAYLDRVTAWVQGNHGLEVEVHPEVWEIIGNVPGAVNGTASAAGVVAALSRARSELSMDSELRSMNRKLTELRAAERIVDGEVAAAERMVNVAKSQVELAQLRVQQARAQLEFFDSREFTPELWENLARAQHSLSRRYLDSAMRAAFLMERAFEFEYDTEVNRIRFDYASSALHGLLAGDFLLADVDQFSYDRLVETEKRVPAKVVVSLADRYPFQFYQGFQRTGRIDFETSLEDFDQWCPGSFQRKLRRVEVVVEGLIGPQGACGTLTNSGVSYDRGREGQRRIRLQKPETMVLSRFDMRNDGVAFVIDEEQVLSTFENSGVASGWILDFPPSSNDLDYRTITNVYMLLYFDTYYNESVRDLVRAEIAASESCEYSIGLGVREHFPDEFFALQNTGEVGFELRSGFFPRHHVNPVLRDLYMVIDVHPEPPVSGLVTKIEAVDAEVSASQSTDTDGMICTGDEDEDEPLNVLRGVPLSSRWNMQIDRAANQELFDAGFSWDKVNNVHLFAEYTYTPRGQSAFDLDLSTSPLANFEVVDDPKAIIGGPSNWSFDQAAAAIRQTSLIHGSAGTDQGPIKPGTYLIHKSSSGWPLLSDVVLRCQMESAVGGGIGVVFRYQDRDNFYFFLMDAGNHYRRIGKKIAGKFTDLDIAAVELDDGYIEDITWELAVSAVGDAFVACLDGEQVLAGRDSSLTRPGRVGLYTWNDDSASFLGLSLRSP